MNNIWRSVLSICLIIIFSIDLKAAVVDTVKIWSPSMQRNIKSVVICPEKQGRYPVIYLLHGYSGSHKTWIDVTKPELPELAEKNNVIFVCPDGGNSWYFDSAVDKTIRYMTFITSELIMYIDNHYSTVACRSGRAITGFSMGGHGALWCALNSNMYCAAGSMSGGVNIVSYPDSWGIKKILGNKEDNIKLWESSSIINNAEKLKGIKLIIDCGTDDFFYNDNIAFHNKLISYKIPHDFISRPGGHTHGYWNNSLDYQILFFCKCFKL